MPAGPAEGNVTGEGARAGASRPARQGALEAVGSIVVAPTHDGFHARRGRRRIAPGTRCENPPWQAVREGCRDQAHRHRGSLRRDSLNAALLRAAAGLTQLAIGTIRGIPLYDGDLE